MRRFSLLFSVNGGAFAIAKLITGNDQAVVLGHLKVSYLAAGSIIFTVLIVIDIYLWAQKMKEEFLGNLAFGIAGKAILLSLGILIISAWLLVAIS